MSKLCDPAAERAVLAAMFRNGHDTYLDVSDLVSANTFTVDANQALYRCLCHIMEPGPSARPDMPSLMSAAKSLGFDSLFAKKDDLQYARAVCNMPVEPANARRMAGKIKKLEVARELEQKVEIGLSQLRDVTGEESIDQILAAAEGPLFEYASNLAGNGQVTTQRMGENAEEHLTYLMDNPREMVGISTGLPIFDRSIGGGLRPNSMDIIAARMKVGKSMIVDHVSLHVAGNLELPAFNLDTEMSHEEHLMRVAANLSGLPINDIERGVCGIRPEDRAKVIEAAKRLKDMPYYYRAIAGEAFEETMSAMRRWVMRDVGLDANGKAKPCVIIFDYLKLMSAGSMLKDGLAEYQVLGFMATTLKNFAKRYAVPVMTFAQLNREGIDGDSTGAVAGSDRIAMYGTSLTYYRLKTEEEKGEGPVEGRKYSHMLKNKVSRHGPGVPDDDFIHIRTDYSRARIEEGPLNSELSKSNGGFEVKDDGQNIKF